ncbi:hypothetical protein AB833_08810 [Chromatiales bacterium (ex Bugula neritina AB1)]|nr:hypothetical protein AB833_08810 [Chromatiales bacterium (ex Bugula neritina AB1)]
MLVVFSSVSQAAPELALSVGGAKILTIGSPVKTVFVGDPGVATVKAPTSKKLFITGVGTGTTTLVALDASGRVLLERDISVSQNSDTLSRALKRRFPTSEIEVEPGPGSLHLKGEVDSLSDYNAVNTTAEKFLGQGDELINHLGVAGSTQVSLRVKIAEVSRTVNEAFGINWSAVVNKSSYTLGIFDGRTFLDADGAFQQSSAASYLFSNNNTNGPVDLNAVIDALSNNDTFTILAEPNLTAVSGESASFLAGGEFPVPSSFNDSVSVTFKPFGISLDFTPTVMPNGRIRMRVQPEISELSTSAAVTSNGFEIPSTQVRRLDTTVEVEDGQSFAIGGLLQNNYSDSINRLPGLGHIPVLGQLFSSNSYRRNETELVVVVTPEVVKQRAPENTELASRLLRRVSGVEYILASKIAQRKGVDLRGEALIPGKVRLKSRAGFIY